LTTLKNAFHTTLPDRTRTQTPEVPESPRAESRISLPASTSSASDPKSKKRDLQEPEIYLQPAPSSGTGSGSGLQIPSAHEGTDDAWDTITSTRRKPSQTIGTGTSRGIGTGENYGKSHESQWRRPKQTSHEKRSSALTPKSNTHTVSLAAQPSSSLEPINLPAPAASAYEEILIGKEKSEFVWYCVSFSAPFL
jgi:hypothetical protein